MNFNFIMMHNKIHKTATTILLFSILWLPGIVFMPLKAETSAGDSTFTRRLGQITFIYPMGTNGTNSRKCINNFSVNILSGISSGTNGFETGGLVNIDLGKIKGFQSAGLVNLVLGETAGMQAAGLLNIVKKNMRAFQVGGLVNINLNEIKGMPAAGLLNFGAGNFQGVSIAGIANIYNCSSKGLLAGGLVNLDRKDQQGVQISGILNITCRNGKGAQISGISNVVHGNMEGAQIGGIFNYAHRFNGLQLGFINYADTVNKGIQIGFLSFVKHGYYKIEFEYNETFFTNINFKTGTQKLYNILSVGSRFYNDLPLWGVTYGLGTLIPVSEIFNFNIDLTSTHINEASGWTQHLNMLNRLKFNVACKFMKGVEVFGGISANLTLTRPETTGSFLFDTKSFPYITFYKHNYWGTQMRIYPGINFGIRL
jgi:hypothetical protein